MTTAETIAIREALRLFHLEHEDMMPAELRRAVIELLAQPMLCFGVDEFIEVVHAEQRRIGVIIQPEEDQEENFLTLDNPTYERMVHEGLLVVPDKWLLWLVAHPFEVLGFGQDNMNDWVLNGEPMPVYWSGVLQATGTNLEELREQARQRKRFHWNY